jgi:uncharacterized secreted protein with C-terminal beta-propeller domain
MAVFGYGLYILDISDPSNPAYVGSYNTSVYKIFVSDNYVYAVGDQFDLKIIDVSDPSSPALVGSYGTPGYVYSMFISGNYGFVCWYYEQVIGSEIIDVSDPANPVTITSIPDIGGDVIIRGDNAGATMPTWPSGGSM